MQSEENKLSKSIVVELELINPIDDSNKKGESSKRRKCGRFCKLL